MNKKRIGYTVFTVFIIVVFISIMITGSNTNREEDSQGEYDSSYYVESNHNVFVKMANFCDNCCYYVVDMIFGGVEKIFSSFTGN